MITSTVKVGVPDVTCLIYEAKDGGPVEDCTKPDINLCRLSVWLIFINICLVN